MKYFIYSILIENGADNLNRADLGGDIHNDNPGEELNRFPIDNLGKHYGYPFCWTVSKILSCVSSLYIIQYDIII